MNNRNVIKTQRFHAAPVQAYGDLLWHNEEEEEEDDDDDDEAVNKSLKALCSCKQIFTHARI